MARNERSKPSKGRLLLALLGIAIAIACEIAAVTAFLKVREIGQWPTVEGEIVESKLVVDSTGYLANIHYTYRVDGQDHRASSVRISGASGREREKVAWLVEKYWLGRKALVYYDPSDPNVAYLEPGVDIAYYPLVVLPVLAALALLGYVLCQFEACEESVAETPIFGDPAV